MKGLRFFHISCLVGTLLLVFSCSKRTDIDPAKILERGEVLGTSQSTLSSSFLTNSSGKWEIVWKQELRFNSNLEYDTTTISIPYTYPVAGTFTVNCHGNTYDTGIFIHNTFEYEKLRFFNTGEMSHSFLTKQQQPVSYTLNCSLHPQVYTLSTPFSFDGNWTFLASSMRLSWNYVEGYTADNFPVTRFLVGDVNLVDNDRFYFEGIDSSYHQSPTTSINPPVKIKYLVVKSN